MNFSSLLLIICSQRESTWRCSPGRQWFAHIYKGLFLTYQLFSELLLKEQLKSNIKRHEDTLIKSRSATLNCWSKLKCEAHTVICMQTSTDSKLVIWHPTFSNHVYIDRLKSCPFNVHAINTTVLSFWSRSNPYIHHYVAFIPRDST